MYELLSGLAVRDTERSPIPESGREAEKQRSYLVEHLHNIPDGLIPNILDVNAGWNLELATRLYKFALRCTNQLNKEARPDIHEFIQEFMNEADGQQIVEDI